MIENPQLATPSAALPLQRVNFSYVFWLMTTIMSVLAGLSLVANVGVFAVNGIGAPMGWPPVFPDMDHVRWMAVTGLLATIGTASHFVRMRSEALARAIVMVRFPDAVIAEFRPSDRILDKFVCRAIVSVGVFSLEIADKVEQELLILHADLEKGLSIAITDPVTRYSKAKIEETLKLALGRHLSSSELASVTMHSLKQKRVPTFTNEVQHRYAAELRWESIMDSSILTSG